MPPKKVGENIKDDSSYIYAGITTIPILKSDTERLRSLRKRLYEPEFAALLVVDFSNIAQSCNIYSDYVLKAASVPSDDFRYLGVTLDGDKKIINKLTGSLPLFR